MKAIFKKELRALMGGLRGWGYVAIAMLGAGTSALLVNLLSLSSRFEMGVNYIALFLMAATVITATDSFQSDRRQNTERVLFSMPLKTADIVVGKWLAHLVPVVISGVCMCVFPLILSFFGKISWEASLAAILALTFLGAAMMSVGLCMSACSRNRLIAVVAIAAVLLASWAAPMAANLISTRGSLSIMMMISFMVVGFTAVYLLSGNAVAGIIAAAVVEVPVLLAYLQGNGAKLLTDIGSGVAALNLFEGLNSFVNGLMDGRALIVWAAIAALFAFITVLVESNRRQAKRRTL